MKKRRMRRTMLPPPMKRSSFPTQIKSSFPPVQSERSSGIRPVVEMLEAQDRPTIPAPKMTGEKQMEHDRKMRKRLRLIKWWLAQKAKK